MAHDEVFAIAAVSDDPTVLAIGIDLEPATPLESDLAGLILRPDEDLLDAHLAFTLKEAAYKAWSTLGGRLLDHADVRLKVAPDTFRAEVVPDGVTSDRPMGRRGWSLDRARGRPTTTSRAPTCSAAKPGT